MEQPIWFVTQGLGLLACAIFLCDVLSIYAANAPITQIPASQFMQTETCLKIFGNSHYDKTSASRLLIDLLELRRKSVIAEIGLSTNCLTAQLAGVLSKGRIYAVGNEPEEMAYLIKMVRRENLDNVIVI